MKTASRARMLACLAGLGLALSSLTGCQTWVGGMTLPSGRYLEHYPQYFPEDPDFPLSRELATQEAQAGLLNLNADLPPGGGLPAAPLGGPVPGVVPPGQ